MKLKIVKFSAEIKSLKNDNKELEKQVSHERKSWENDKAELESKIESLNGELRRSKLQGAMKNVLGDVKLSRIDLENKEKHEREESERREAENIQNDKNRKLQTSILPDDYVETVRAKQWFETFNMNALRFHLKAEFFLPGLARWFFGFILIGLKRDCDSV